VEVGCLGEAFHEKVEEFGSCFVEAEIEVEFGEIFEFGEIE
jgi:hypothetical protein